VRITAAVAQAISNAANQRPKWSGSRETKIINVAMQEGPANSGVASGTMNGSSGFSSGDPFFVGLRLGKISETWVRCRSGP